MTAWTWLIFMNYWAVVCMCWSVVFTFYLTNWALNMTQVVKCTVTSWPHEDLLTSVKQRIRRLFRTQKLAKHICSWLRNTADDVLPPHLIREPTVRRKVKCAGFWRHQTLLTNRAEERAEGQFGRCSLPFEVNDRNAESECLFQWHSHKSIVAVRVESDSLGNSGCGLFVVFVSLHRKIQISNVKFISRLHFTLVAFDFITIQRFWLQRCHDKKEDWELLSVDMWRIWGKQRRRRQFSSDMVIWLWAVLFLVLDCGNKKMQNDCDCPYGTQNVGK